MTRSAEKTATMLLAKPCNCRANSVWGYLIGSVETNTEAKIQANPIRRKRPALATHLRQLI